MPSNTLRTRISVAKEDQIIVRGHPLTELMGKVPFGDAAFLVLTGKLPNNHESRLFNAILVALIEHGVATQAFAARWIIRTAPESVQGAVAAGILGVGNQFGGVAEKAGEMLSQGMALIKQKGIPPDEAAEKIVDSYLEKGNRIPGLGHQIHRGGDPRVQRLLDIASEEGYKGGHLDLMLRIRSKLEAKTGRKLVVNAMGAIGAAVLDLGLDWRIAKGLMVLSKVPGILAHVHEEMKNPIIGDLAEKVREMVQYES